MESRLLVVAVETTGALGAAWPVLFTETFAEDSSTQTNASTPGMMALVSFNSHADQPLFEQTPWTSSADVILRWLNVLSFNGGGFGDVAVAEALTEALWMCCPGPELPPVTQHRHCLLIAASEPRRIPTPVVRPLVLFNAKGEREYQTQQWWSADAVAVSKAFAAVSLSVISPRKIASLGSIYDGARRNPRAAAEISNWYPQHLILISEDFPEGERAIRGAPVASDTTVVAVTPSSSGGTGNLLTAQGPVTSGTEGMDTRSMHNTMDGGNVNTNANMNTATNLGAVVASAVATASSSLTSSQAAILAGTSNLLTTLGPVTAGMDAGSGLRTVVGGTLSTEANVNPIANTNLVSPTGGLSSNQPLPLQVGTGPNVGGTQDTIADMNPTANTNLESPAGGLGSNQFISTRTGPTGPTVKGTNANMNPTSNTSLVSPAAAGGGLHSNQFLSTPLQPGVGLIPLSGASQAQANPLGVSVGTTRSMNTGAYALVEMVRPPSGLPQAVEYVSQSAPPAVITPPQRPSGASLGLHTGVQAAMNMMPSTSGLPMANVQYVQPRGSRAVLTPPPQSSGVSSGLHTGVHAAMNMMPSTSELPIVVQDAPQPGPRAVVSPPQQPSGELPWAKVWEGYLTAPRGTTIVRICKIEAFRRTTASERLASDWLPTMHIVRMISREKMEREFEGRLPALVLFRPFTQHKFFIHVAREKWCVIIRLPSQTMVLTSTPKPDILQGLLFQGPPI